MIGLKKNDPRPLYLQVKESLRDEIAAGRFAAGEPIPDERSLASDLGLSRMTVRRALVELTQEGYFERIPGRGTFLRADHAALHASRELHASADAVPAGFAPIPTLALVGGFERIDVSDGFFYGRMMRGMQDGCGERAHLALRRLPEAVAPFLEQLRAAKTAQGLLAVSITAPETLRALAACGLPVVFFDCATPEVPGAYDIVVHANEAAGYQAASALIDLGHRRIGMLVHASSNDAATAKIGEIARDRRAGVERALRERGLPVHPAWIRPAIPHSTSAYALTRDLLRAPANEAPTALVCSIDEMAAGSIAAAKDAGLRVPDGVSVAGIGDVGVFSVPALASARMQVERSSEDAVRMLLERIARPDLPHRKHVLSTEFIARGSIGMPRAD